MSLRDSLGQWDADERTWWTGHSSIGLRFPIRVDWMQLRLALGITCPRHRAIWKAKLGPVGRLLPNLEWRQDEQGDWRLVNVRVK